MQQAFRLRRLLSVYWLTSWRPSGPLYDSQVDSLVVAVVRQAIALQPLPEAMRVSTGELQPSRVEEPGQGVSGRPFD